MSTLKRLTKELTSEKLEEMRQERINKIKKLTLEKQLGFYVGEDIVHRFLPTLSTDEIQSRNCIKVSEEDSCENKKLNDEWFSSTRYGDNWDGVGENGDKDMWEKYYNHNKMLELKYLPHKLVCHLPSLNVENIDEFKKGLIDSLWDCDMCSYSLKPENIKIYNDDDYYFTIFEFILGQLVKD